MRFDLYHPGLNLFFFAVVIACSLLWNHPVLVGISFVCAFIYSVKLKGKKALVLNGFLILFIGLWAAWFAFYNHFGITNLGENFIGNKITLESIIFGLVQGTQIAAFIMWLNCVFELFTTDKVEYLLGRVSPKIALGFSVVVRAVPVVRAHMKKINGAQWGIGQGSGQGNLIIRVKHTLRRWSSLISWSIERFLEMSHSMRSRGAILSGRTSFALYRFDNRDRSLFLLMTGCVSVFICGVILNQTYILYQPAIIFGHLSAISIIFYFTYTLFCLLPFSLQVYSEWRFDCLRKEIPHLPEAFLLWAGNAQGFETI